MSRAEDRDRELENLLGQFLVASFQSDKLAELIHEKLSFRSTPKEMRIVLQSNTSRPPLLLTIRVEQYVQRKEEAEKKEGSYRLLCVLESPELDIPVSKAKNDVESIMQGSFEWWTGQGQYSHLKLEKWTITTNAISSDDSIHLKELYRTLRTLEAKRKGDIST